MIKEINTGLSCSMFFSDDSLNALNNFIENRLQSNRKVFLLCDENTSTHCLPFLKQSIVSFNQIILIEIGSGEKNKSMESCLHICNQLLKNNADKSSVLLNLGGGIICDTGGFAASCFKRGIEFVHIPTTLLAITDAAIGGKTALNIGNYKNQIGTFALPSFIFVYTPFLKTLDNRNLKNGFAEMLKHGLINDKKYFNDLLLKEKLTDNPLLEVSIDIKNKIVSKDWNETGVRKILNFGHTIGHAIESHFQTLTGNELMHGEAIAAGMICESFISNQTASLSQNEMNEIAAGILKFFPKINPFSIEELMPYIAADKKNVNAQYNFTLLDAIGTAKYDCFVTAEVIADSINFYNAL